MKFKDKVMRFTDRNLEELNNPMYLGFAIYIYYIICILGMIVLGLFFSKLDESLQRTIIDCLLIIPMFIAYFWNKRRHKTKEKWTKRKMKWKNFLCICLLSRVASWIGALIDLGIVSLAGIDYSSLYGTPEVMGYNFAAILSAIVLAPICEELIFRGIALSPFEKKDNKLEAILFTSITFGLMHSNWYQAIVAVLDGFLYGYVAIEFGLFYAVLLHAFHNAWVYLAYFLRPFINVNYISFTILVLVVCNIKNIIKQFKSALKSERGYSIEKQVAYFMNPIVMLFSILWILEILNIV